MAKELTMSALANIGCSIGMKIGRWNACTAWAVYELDQDRTRVFIRLHDHADMTPLSRAIPVSRAYDMDSPADGTSREFELPDHGLAMTAWRIEEWLIPQLLELVPEHG